MSVEDPAVADILDVVPAAVVLVGPDLRISAWNRAAEVLYGHPAADVTGVSVLDVLVDPDDREVAARRFERAGTGRAWEGDARVNRRDGALLVSSFRLVPAGGGAVALIATDGMDQGLAEQERAVLLSAEHAARSTAEDALALLEAVIGSAPVGIAVLDLDMCYVRVNEAYAALTGRAPAAHVGGAFGAVRGHPEVAADLRRTMHTGNTTVGRVIEHATSEGGPVRYLSISYFPVRTAAGEVIGAGLTTVEITQIKQAEAERAVLLQRAEEARGRLSVLATASSVLAATLNVDELLTGLAAVLAPQVADWCALIVWPGAGRQAHFALSCADPARAAEVSAAASAAGPPAGPGWAGGGGPGRLAVGSTLGAVLGVDPAAVPAGPARHALAAPLGASLAVPIDARGEVLGALVLASGEGRTLGEEEVELAAEVAQRAALAVGNARAFQQEREIAETLQRALLPATVPVIDGLDVAVRYLPATDGASVGGDWYDVMVLDEASTGIVIGDVIGHDVSASAAMGQLRSALRVIAHDGHRDPGMTLGRVDRVMQALGLPYASCIFGVLDRPSGSLQWSNAGHPPPVLVHAGEARVLAGEAGVLLGVTGGADAHVDAVTLVAGDTLVLYTDGLVERRGESLETGLQELVAAASDAAGAGAGAEEVCEALVASMLPPGEREDDVALLVVVVRPPGQRCRLELEAVPESVAAARRFAVDALLAHGWEERVDVAALLVSELVTNAIRHAAGPCALTLSFSSSRVELAVEDADPRRPAPRNADLLDEGGRGLYMVDALSDGWGSRPAGDGKAIWFALDAHS